MVKHATQEQEPARANAESHLIVDNSDKGGGDMWDTHLLISQEHFRSYNIPNGSNYLEDLKRWSRAVLEVVIL